MADKMKDLKELLNLILDGVAAGIKATSDGKIAIEDAALLLTLIPDLVPAVEGIGNIPAEVASMTEEDAANVVAFVSAKLSLNDDHAKKIVDASLKAAVAAYSLVKAIKG